MKVLVDTSVWSLALRRAPRRGPNAVAEKLADLVQASMVVLMGPVHQELLSGISDEQMFLDLKSKLLHFDDEPISVADYETAARFFNTCRSHGLQGSYIDFLICAVAANHGLLIFTADQDFKLFAKHLPIRLFQFS